MSAHLLYLDEIIQSSFEHDFLDTTDTICLRQKNRKWRLKIGWKSWKNIRLDIYWSELLASVYSKSVSSEILECDTDFSTFLEKNSEVIYPSMMNIDIFSTTECSENNKGT
jgi:hypothetical protein